MINNILSIFSEIPEDKVTLYIVVGALLAAAIISFIVTLVVLLVKRRKKKNKAVKSAQPKKKTAAAVGSAGSAAGEATTEKPTVKKESIPIYEDGVNALMTDDEAKLQIEEMEVPSSGYKDVIYWIKLDLIGSKFADGEKVTLAEIKRRIPYVPRSVTYIKVVAEGVLNKSLTVVADSFTIEAVKMILLTGGKVIRLKHVRGGDTIETAVTSAA